MGKCYTCIRYLMFVFNLIFLLLGMTLVGIGIWLRLDESITKYANMSADQTALLHTIAYVIIVIGSVIMVTSFMGCCGAIIENKCMLVIFFILLFIVAVVFIALGAWVVYAFTLVQQVEDIVTKSLEDGIDKYSDETSFGRSYIDLVQNDWKCCGASKGILDYPVTQGVQIEACQKYPDEPCVDRIMGNVNTIVTCTLAIIFLTAAIALLGMIFSMTLCCAIRRRE